MARTEASDNTIHSNAQNAKLYLCTLVALLAPLTTGYTMGYSSPAIPNIKQYGIIKTDDESSWFGSLLTVGAVFGGPIAGFFIDKWGRKVTIMLCSVPFVAGWIAIATANGIPGLYIGRILTGVAVGMTCVVTPVYIAEMASADLRGMLGSCFQLSIMIGLLLSYVLGIPLNYSHAAYIGLVLAVLSITLTGFMPDTSRYLLIKGQRDKALKVLTWLRGPMVDVEVECKEIEEGLSNQEKLNGFWNQSVYKPLLISVSLMFFQQWCGINAVLFYTVEIFQTTAPSIDPHVSTVIVGVVLVLSTFLSTLLMDKAGRRVLLIVGGIGMTISLATFGLYYKLTDQNNPADNNSSMLYEFDNATTPAAPSSADLSWLSLTSMIVFIITFSLGWAGIPWLIMSEIFPSKARGTASAISTAFVWIFSFTVTKSFFALKEDDVLGSDGVFWLFAGVCALNVVFVALFVPETKGLALEEIEAKFSGRNNQIPVKPNTAV